MMKMMPRMRRSIPSSEATHAAMVSDVTSHVWGQRVAFAEDTIGEEDRQPQGDGELVGAEC
jgi:hypothetical protein